MKKRILLLMAFWPVLSFAQTFVDIKDSLGIHYSYGSCYFSGGGIAFVDMNNDGYDDLLVASCNGEVFRYYQNSSSGLIELFLPEFANDTQDTKIILPADYDNDGDLDLFFGNVKAPNKMYRNNGNGSFTDVSLLVGLTNNAYNTFTATFGDYDNDGWLDLFVGNGLTSQEKFPNILYHNNGDGTFTSVNNPIISDTNGFSMASAWLDINNDGLLDLYVANDRFKGNKLFKNLGGGLFQDISHSSGTDTAMFGMSVAVTDYDSNGFLDIYITNGPDGNVFYANNGDETFTEKATDEGIQLNKVSWGAVFFDFDNDMDNDLYVAAAMTDTTPEEFNSLFEIENGSFTDRAGVLIDSNRAQSMGVAIGDLDQDGFYDLAVLNTQGKEMNIYHNQGNSNHFVRIKLRGVVSNRDAVGSWIWVYAGGRKISRFTHCGFDFASQNSYTHIIGIGQNTTIDSVVVRFPSGETDVHTHIMADSFYLLVEDTSTVVDTSDTTTSVRDLIRKEQNLARVFPNPVENQLQIVFENNLEKTVSLFDIRGRLLRKYTISNKTLQINTSNLANGIYIVLVKQGKGIQHFRVVKR